MEKTRTEKTLRNVNVSVTMHVLNILSQFVNRSVFVYFLSREYLGLNGLFTNVLSLLSLAELGIGSAMVYALYRPLSENNQVLIKSLMRFYKKTYTVIGFIVIGLGILLTPFLPYLIKDMPDNMPYLGVYYIIYVFNIGVSYFCTYKRSILICDQKQYITSVTEGIKLISIAFIQILVLWITHSYLMYLLVMLVCTVTENIVVTKIANKTYPYLKEKDVQPLPREELNTLKKNVAAMFCHKIGSVIITSTDNLIISKFVGLVVSGLYSNYTLVVNALNGVLVQLFNAITAGVGNLIAHNDKEHDKEIFEKVLFGNFWIYCFSSVCMFSLFEPFIRLWMGEDFQLGLATVGVIALSFYLTGMRKTVLIFRDAAGVFWYDRYKALFESGLNLVVSIPLTIRFGVAGTLWGTVISTLAVSFWVEARVLYKHHFQASSIPYFMRQAMYLGLTAGIAALTCYACTWIPFSGIVGFLIRALLCLILPNLILWIIFGRTSYFAFYWNLVRNKLLKRGK